MVSEDELWLLTANVPMVNIKYKKRKGNTKQLAGEFKYKMMYFMISHINL